MGTSVLHIKTEVECRVYLFDEEKGIAKPGTYFNLEVRKGEQDLLFVSTEDESIRCQLLYSVEENDCDYPLSLERSQFKQAYKEVNTSEATDEEMANGIEDEYGVVYSPDGTELLECTNNNLESYQVKEGCKVIRGGAFYSVILSPSSLTAITLPAGLTHIGDSAFEDCKNLTAITLPDSLTHIGDRAFAWCVNLTAITLPASLTHIGNSAFGFCMNLTAITLTASLTHIGDSAFMCCKNLTAITLPASLTHIGHGAFGGCSNLTAIALPAGLTHIGDSAFSGCVSLTAITLPATLTHIGDGAFLRTGIRSVVNSSPHFSFQDGCLIDVQGKRMIAFLSDKAEVTLPDGLTHIGDMAFLDCKNLTAITLPATLTHIGDRAFEWCKNLTDIHIPQGMTEHFKALLPPDLHSKLKELEALPKSPEGTLPENTNIFSKLKLYAAKPKLLEGAMSGLFTINANGDKVRFSQGNLQYQSSTNIWRFAEHQWDYMGAANSKIGATNSGWIDLFGWGTGNNPTLASENNSDYNTFVDWGVNAISGGGNAANLWRTLTREEWDYILNARADAAVKMATGLINGVHGLILLPDIWAMPSECSFNARFAGWDSNQYTLSTWAKMEAAGAIFLPATGRRLGLSVVNVAKYGYYWSSTPFSYSKDCAYDMGFLGGRAACMYYSNPRCAGSSVRLVRDSN